MMIPDIDIIIPAYNEADRIRPMLDAYVDFFAGSDATLIIVVNGSSDSTYETALEYAARVPDLVSVIHIEAAVGKGGAIMAGWRDSEAEWVGFVDADGATPPDEFARIIGAATTADGAIGSRFGNGAVIHNRQGWLRSAMSRLFIAWVKLLFQMPFRDTQCGAKVFRRATVLPVLDQMHSTNMNFDVELLWRMQEATIHEVPTVWTDQPGSAALGSKRHFLHTGWRMVSDLVRLRFNK